MNSTIARPQSPRLDALDLYTVAETAIILGVNQKLVFTWIRDGALPAIRLGTNQRLVRIRRVDLEEFVEKDFQASTPPGSGGSLRGEPPV